MVVARETPRMIGIKAHTPAMCSCHMCGNPRKYWKEKTIQERRNESNIRI